MILHLYEITLGAVGGAHDGCEAKVTVATVRRGLTAPEALRLATMARDAAGLGTNFNRLLRMEYPHGGTVYFDFNEAVREFNTGGRVAPESVQFRVVYALCTCLHPRLRMEWTSDQDWLDWLEREASARESCPSHGMRPPPPPPPPPPFPPNQDGRGRPEPPPDRIGSDRP